MRTCSDELMHHGVKGMKWGVRRFKNADGTLTAAGKKREVKQNKKNVDALYKGLNRTQTGASLVTVASISKFNPKDYKKAAELMDTGRLFTEASFEKNYEKGSVDLYINGEKTPTMSAKIENGKEFSAAFVDKAAQTRYDDFVKYYNKR